MYDLPSRRSDIADGSLLRIRLLGGMEAVTSGGLNVLPVGSKTKALLAILALSDRKSVLRKTIADLLWSNRADDLARASLRQEIHRLTVSLNPLGVAVIEVQRHALSLKPFLTGVDVEKILHGGVEVLPLVPPPSDGFLPELNAIDPAFDAWLHTHRKRLERHIRSLYSQVLAQVSDPDEMLFHADQLLKRDVMNEIGWRGRLQALVAKGEMARAARGCAEIIELFNYKLGSLPGAETLRLIRQIQDQAVSGSFSGGFFENQNVFPEGRGSGGGGAVSEPAMRDATATSLTSPPFLATSAPRTLGRLAIEAFPSPTQLHLVPTAFALAEQLEVELVRLDTLQVVYRPGSQANAPGGMPLRSTQPRMDFRLVNIVHSHEGEVTDQNEKSQAWVTIRLISCKDDDYVIWADRLPLPKGGQEITAFNRYVAWSLQWALVIWEGQRALNRPAASLSATSLAARAAVLLTHCDATRQDELLDLIARAEARDADNAIVLHVKGLVQLTRYLCQWHPPESNVSQDLFHCLARVGAYLRCNPLSIHLMLYARLVFPGQYDQARALYAENSAQSSKYALPSLSCFNAFNALLDDDRERALREIRHYASGKAMFASLALLEPFSALILHACGEHGEAHQVSSAFVCLYPRSQAGLLVYLLGLIKLDAQKEASCVSKRIIRLAPEVSVSAILTRLSFLPSIVLNWVREMLLLSDLPR